MKIFLILGIIAVIAIGGLFLQKKEETSANPAQTTTTETTKSVDNTVPPVNDHGMTPEEHAQMMGESTQGTDVGMEMPMMDTTQMNMTAPSDARMIMVNGKNFEFDVKEIRVKKGEKITIHFMSTDGFHDFVIDEFNVQTQKLKTGGMDMVTFTADKTGTFEYYCSIGSHRANGMVGKLIVE